MKKIISVITGIALIIVSTSNLRAHCDTMEGPVVKAAQQALEKKDADLVLMWVSQENEEEVKAALQKTLVARKQGREAQELADLYFFETVVRLHRMGEGEPYAGIKPAGAHVCEVIPVADKALESSSEKALLQMIEEKVQQGVKELYRNVQEKQKQAKTSVEAGREYVEAYVVFMRYLESVYEAANLGCEKHAGKFELLLEKR